MRPDAGIAGLLWEESEDEGRLGAARVEVLELGRARRAAVGQLGGALDFLSGLFKDIFGFLATAIGTPLDLVGQGASLVIDTISGQIARIPLIGELVAQVLTIGRVVINAGLHLPETLLRGISNLFGSFAKLPEGKQKELTEKAVGQVMQFAKDQGKEREVGQLIRENPPTVGGQPVAGAAAGGTPALARAAVGLGVPAALAAGAALVA